MRHDTWMTIVFTTQRCANPEPSSSWATRVRVMKCDHAVQLCTCCICGCTVHIKCWADDGIVLNSPKNSAILWKPLYICTFGRLSWDSKNYSITWTVSFRKWKSDWDRQKKFSFPGNFSSTLTSKKTVNCMTLARCSSQVMSDMLSYRRNFVDRQFNIKTRFCLDASSAPCRYSVVHCQLIHFQDRPHE